ncbi:hypothetical protein CgunFtcFv8_024866 [Champsocephalus gunnari]|uniref:Uncharacterized protein n=1 Tax=Champsocephalus gunnari TaxID=52237 RepID=A0AAN8HLS3_CHAGU|nr:hypothetical protein CgunFtcFv8_024866 [Champsocephalus gunnari]
MFGRYYEADVDQTNECDLYGSRDSPVKTGYSPGNLSRRLAPSRTVGARGYYADECPRKTPARPIEEHVVPSPDCTLPGPTPELPFTARLSAERVKAFRACLAHFQPRKYVLFRSCLRLLGLMASAILVVRLGRLHMREFQHWVAALRLDPVRHGARRVLVTMKCIMALRHWLHPTFLVRGVPMGAVLSRKVVTTDACLGGWGGIYEGRPGADTSNGHT